VSHRVLAVGSRRPRRDRASLDYSF